MKFLSSYGYQIKRLSSDLEQFNEDFVGSQILEFAYKRSMQTRDSLYNLWLIGEYLEANKIKGDIVECGVWRGASIQLLTGQSLFMKWPSREFYMFDTFSGMTEPTFHDVRLKDKIPAHILGWKHNLETTGASHLKGIPAYATLQDVKNGFSELGVDENHLNFIQGDVLATIPKFGPSEISLLRIDTDWYESTKHILEHFYPRLVTGGVLILDDFDYWEGAREATVEFFNARGLSPLLIRQGGGGRIYVKS